MKEIGEPVVFDPPDSVICLDEVKEAIIMPEFDAETAAAIGEHKQIELNPQVISELREYVATIASLYRDNPFHNFEHACHVTMSVTKLLHRVVAPDVSEAELDKIQEAGNLHSHLHYSTHGIVSDPLGIFAVIFSALIHDVDHRGVSNAQLAKEQPEMGAHYRNKSVAEQNSLDLAWEVLMSPQFSTLRSCLFGTQSELMRFRQLVVNLVLATDIFDKEINDLRKKRWEKAFSEGPEDVHNLRAIRSFSSTFCKLLTFHIPCSTGMCIKSGTNSCSRRCTVRSAVVAWNRIPRSFGMTANLVFSTITSFRWQRNWPSVMYSA